LKFRNIQPIKKGKQKQHKTENHKCNRR